MDEHNLIKEQDRALQAKHLLEHPILQEAYGHVIEKLRSDWENGKSRTPEDRERIWDALQSLKSIWGYMESVMTTGKLAETELIQIRLEKDRSNDRARRTANR